MERTFERIGVRHCRAAELRAATTATGDNRRRSNLQRIDGPLPPASARPGRIVTHCGGCFEVTRDLPLLAPDGGEVNRHRLKAGAFEDAPHQTLVTRAGARGPSRS